MARAQHGARWAHKEQRVIPGACDTAVGLFADKRLHLPATLLAALSPYAIDYIKQAPALVLAAAWDARLIYRKERLRVAHRFIAASGHGPRLNELMKAYGLAPPLRALSGRVLRHEHWGLLKALSSIPATALAQSVPKWPDDQRKWLESIERWRTHMGRLFRNGDLFWPGRQQTSAAAGLGGTPSTLPISPATIAPRSTRDGISLRPRPHPSAGMPRSPAGRSGLPPWPPTGRWRSTCAAAIVCGDQWLRVPCAANARGHLHRGREDAPLRAHLCGPRCERAVAPLLGAARRWARGNSGALQHEAVRFFHAQVRAGPAERALQCQASAAVATAVTAFVDKANEIVRSRSGEPTVVGDARPPVDPQLLRVRRRKSTAPASRGSPVGARPPPGNRSPKSARRSLARCWALS